MSSKETLFSSEYTQNVIKHGLNHKDFVMGFISQERLTDDRDLVTMTPGVSLVSDSDELEQKYHSPKKVIIEKKSDIIIVGRGIYASQDPLTAAKAYQKHGWRYLSLRKQ